MEDCWLIQLSISVKSTKNYFQLRQDIKIYADDRDERVEKIGEYLAHLLYPATNFDLKTETTPGHRVRGHINLLLQDEDDEELGEEGDKLEVTDSYVDISAKEPADMIMAMEILR